ncbi:MAG TPA: cation-translocating P-type ATPase, partial [Povalibacter sp.]
PMSIMVGVGRGAQSGVLVKEAAALERLEKVDTLVVDKTGTLTENRMRVVLLQSLETAADLRDDEPVTDAGLLEILSTAAAASKPAAFDPMERAIHESLRARVPATASSQLKQMKLIREYDLTPELPAVTHVWKRSGGGTYLVAVKGAPETVLNLCQIEAAERARLLKQVAVHASHGLRLLAVATGQHVGDALPASPGEFDLRLLGLIGLADPLRPEVPGTLSVCHEAGIRVVMITGDHPGTALAIAAQAGLDTSAGSLTGTDIASLDEQQLRERVLRTNVFSRMTPDQKLRLVQALQANGEVVAMTGDGVNDAPSLKAANIGVAMGARGTDVAREAASIVLVNDAFGSLIAAIRLGRRVYDNIRNAMTFIVAVHIPIAGMGLLPVVFGWPLLFFPLHVLFLEFVIDPSCAFVFEADREAPDIMRRRPRRPNAPLFSRATLLRGVTLGIVILATCMLVYGVALQYLPDTMARALAFIALVSANLTLIFVTRSRSETFASVLARQNRVFWWIVALAATALALIMSNTSIASLFRFTTPPFALMMMVSLAAMSVVLVSGLALRSRPSEHDCRTLVG